jgi:hypothetical protein
VKAQPKALARWCELLIAEADQSDFFGAEPSLRLGLPTEGDVPENRDREVAFVVNELPADEPPEPSGDEDQLGLDGEFRGAELEASDAPEAGDQILVSFPPTRSPNEDYPEPTDEADARASKTGFKAARRNQWLPYLHEALSPEEAIELVDWVRTALVSPAAARRNAGGLLGLMQVTGLPLELVLSSPVSDASSNSAFTPEGTWRKKILREPRAWTAQLAQLPLLRRWTNRVTFDMPIESKRWLHAVTRGGMHTTLSHALKLDLKTADTSGSQDHRHRRSRWSGASSFALHSAIKVGTP